jgi:AcrR family transcriptional regulator
MNIATRPKYHHGNLKPALIGAARDLLALDGPDAMSLRDVARRVGVSATATYRHFADKDHLLAVAAAEGYRELAERLRGAYEKPAGFSGLGMAYIEFAQENPGMFRLMFGPLRRDLKRHPELSEAAADAFAVMVDAARRFGGAGDEDVESMAYAAWSFSHGLARLVLDDVIPRERARKVCDAFLFGRTG